MQSISNTFICLDTRSICFIASDPLHPSTFNIFCFILSICRRFVDILNVHYNILVYATICFT
jgi:hypothetical protein